MFSLWQLTEFPTPKYQSEHTPDYSINHVVLSRTPPGSQTLPRVFTPPLPGAEGNSATAASLVLLTPLCSRGGSCLSSHQWVVPLTMPQISKTGHPAYLPQSWEYFLKCPLPGKVFIFCGLFLLPSVCLNNRECYFSSSCNYFLAFNMKHDKYFCVLGIWASAQALGYRDHLGKFLEQRVSPLGLSDGPTTSSTPCIRTHTDTYNMTLFCSDASESHFRAHIFYSHIEDVRYKCSSKRQ